MRKFLWFRDKDHPLDCAELSPLTFDEFEKIGHWSGCNDTAFDQFLRHNRFYMLGRFNEEALQQGIIKIVEGEPAIDWAIMYGDHDAITTNPPCPCIVFQYPELPEVLLKKPDIHTSAAMVMFQVPAAEVTPAMRYAGKLANFQAVYGRPQVRTKSTEGGECLAVFDDPDLARHLEAVRKERDK